MNYPRLFVYPLFAAAVLVGCAGAQADDESLRDSFADRIETTSAVTDFSRNGDELTFVGPDGMGGSAEWTVTIETSLVEPNEFDEAMPYQGRILSEWTADGEVVEFLGNMSALPDDFLDRGLGQECWAFWVEEDQRWDW